MSELKMPYDQDSANIILSRYSRNAFNKRMKKHFSKAMEILFGPSFIIKVEESSSRMFFYCTICNKEMNCVTSLKGHSDSGNHIKRKESMQLNESTNKITVLKEFQDSFLHYKVFNSETPILGLQMVEAYEKKHRYYYKCNLCGVHGRTNLMYEHLIGDEHTEKYINSRFILLKTKFTKSESAHLRKMVSAMESYSVNDILIIRGKEFYPYHWEDEIYFSQRKEKKKEEDQSRCVVKVVNESSRITGYAKVKEKEDIHSFTYANFEDILWKLNVVVHGHLEDCTDINSSSDLKLGLNIIDYALHALHHSTKEILAKYNDYEVLIQKANDQKNVLCRCLGYLHKRIIPYYEKHPNMKILKDS